MNDKTYLEAWENKEGCKNHVRKTPQRLTTNYIP